MLPRVCFIRTFGVGVLVLIIVKLFTGYQNVALLSTSDVNETIRTQHWPSKVSDREMLETEKIQHLRHQRFQEYCEMLPKRSWHVSGVHQANMYIVDNEHKVLLLTLPKTGSTLWKLTLCNNSKVENQGMQQLETGQKVGFIHKNWFLKNNGFQSVLQLQPDQRKEILDTYFKIITVRHPFDRIESAFFDKIMNYEKVSPMYRKNLVEFVLRRKWSGIISEKVDLTTNVTFEDFLFHIERRPNRHWTSVNALSDPCTLSDSFIAKTETLNMDLRYIISQKLSGRGQPMALNTYRGQGQSDHHRGRHLSLFSQVPNVEERIKKLLPMYKADMEMFGYSYDIVNGQVYATCMSYTEDNLCI